MHFSLRSSDCQTTWSLALFPKSLGKWMGYWVNLPHEKSTKVCVVFFPEIFLGTYELEMGTHQWESSDITRSVMYSEKIGGMVRKCQFLVQIDRHAVQFFLGAFYHYFFAIFLCLPINQFSGKRFSLVAISF